MDKNIAVVRLPVMRDEELAEHLVRWHGWALEDVRGEECSTLRAHHALHHARVAKEDKTLGHTHGLSDAEKALLDQGAEAALRSPR